MQTVTGSSVRIGPTQVLEATSAEGAMIKVMWAGRCAPQDEELLSTAAKVVWDIARDSGTDDERERARIMIRRAVQWRLECGSLEGAYALAHLSDDRETIEDVLVAAVRDREHHPSAARVMAVVQERLDGV